MSNTADDPHDLNRFVVAQRDIYPQALAEIRAGDKRSHWMWFIFPQIDGLGFSGMSKRFAIKSADEATAYVHRPVLGPRLHQCFQALLDLEERSASEIFGSPDDMKLQSSATLFAGISPAGSVFEKVLDKYFAGQRDPKTLELLRK